MQSAELMGVKTMSRAQLEKRYGISIVENGYFDWRGRYIKLYDIYSADGCCWDKGKKTIKEVAEECKVWAHSLLAIKRLYERYLIKGIDI